MAAEIDEGDIDEILIEVDAEEIARRRVDAVELRPAPLLGFQFAIFINIAIGAKLTDELGRCRHAHTHHMGDIIGCSIAILDEVIDDAQLSAVIPVTVF